MNTDLLELLFLSRLLMASWDEVAQETRTRLERAQKWSGVIRDKMVRTGVKQELGRQVAPVFQKLLGFIPSQEQAGKAVGEN